MSQISQVCERINDTFVVKCVEQIQPETFFGLELSDFMSAIIAFFSVLAAGLAAYAAWKANKLSESEARANREHNELSVRPMLDISYIKDSSKLMLSLTISNNGLGPALISRLDLNLGGTLISSQEIFLELIGKFERNYSYRYVIQHGARIRNGKSSLQQGTNLQILFFQIIEVRDRNTEEQVTGSDEPFKVLNDFEKIVHCEVEYSDFYNNMQPVASWKSYITA